MKNKTQFQEKYGPWALVTGASSGIGEEYARQLANRKLNLVLVARREQRLQSLSEHLTKKYNVEVIVVATDLSNAAGIDTVKKETINLEIGLLVNNAGREDSGPFLSTSMDTTLNTLDLNVRAPLQLTHHFAKKMAQRKRGGILFMSSIVAFQGVPLIANYGATKAYDLIFAESIAAELEPYNIDVSAVVPGFTATDLSPDFDFSGLPINPMSPVAVVKKALRKLGTERVIIPGFINLFLYFTGKYFQSRRLNTASFGLVFRKVMRNKLVPSNKTLPIN